MRNATPVPIRQAIVRAHKRGLTYAETAKLLGVGPATVSRVLRLHRERRSVRPKPIRGGLYSPITGDVARALVALVAKMPDATLDELTAALMEKTTVETSRSGVLRALQRLGFSRKKSRSWQRNGTPRSTDGIGGSSAPSSSR